MLAVSALCRVEAGGPEFKVALGYIASLDYIRPCFNKNKNVK